MPWQLRERRPFETRKDYIREALDSAKGHGWQTFEEMAALAGRMLDENSKSRISLPEAAAAAASSILLLSRQQQASAASNGASQTGLADRAVTGAQDASGVRVRPPKRVAGDERSRRAITQERRRRLQYAD